MTEALHEITFNPNPVQRAFILSPAKADLFSSRVGEGKSAALAWSIFYHTLTNPGADWAMLRDTWTNLQGTTLKEFFKWFPPGVTGDWNESKKTYKWREGLASGSVWCCGLDDPTDASKLQSRELAGGAIDEPAPAAQSGGVSEYIFDILFSRLRQPGMSRYAVKLATNNPDETHWTYRRFADPGTPGFKLWQPPVPENVHNLPTNYYEDLRKLWGHRPDMIRRFVEGQFGFMQEGRVVTPEWDDKVHLATGLVPIKGVDLVLLWDFGLNPTCIVTQVTPTRQWLVLDAIVGDGVGVEELIVEQVKPLLESPRYAGWGGRGTPWRHIGDPAGREREQSSANRSAVRVLQKELGGTFRSGPVKPLERIEPLRAVLSRHGLVRVDRQRARPVWAALRGGWHYKVSNTGVVSNEPVKDMHSHPGDALGYGAAILFPLGRLLAPPRGIKRPAHAMFFGADNPRLVGQRPPGGPQDRGSGLSFGPRPPRGIPNLGVPQGQ